MPYQLVHNGVVREFEFYPPVGWPAWVERAYAEDGRRGLPLIVALHGGGQAPATLAGNWPFPLLFNTNDPANWEDRCFVLYPYGFSYLADLTGEPVRGWNTGFSGEYLTTQDDVGFVREMIGAVERMLQNKLDELGIHGRAIDVDRRFLFGYSMGGMMAYRLVHEMPNHWGALWAMSGAYGGRGHDLRTSTVTHPPSGSASVSLFAHHGEMDPVVPPGPFDDPSGREVSQSSHDLYAATGLSMMEADDYASSVRNFAAAVLAYRTHNNCATTAYSHSTAEPDVGGGITSQKAVWRQDTNPANPEVVAYLDPTMDHTNFVPNRYFFAADVWDFFKAHPRIDV
jgi:poly(3-hydroxybutyrate) depolymerase